MGKPIHSGEPNESTLLAKRLTQQLAETTQGGDVPPQTPLIAGVKDTPALTTLAFMQVRAKLCGV